MKVLVIGSGGREHTIVWKLAQSKRVTQIFAIPGNAGMYELAECFPEYNPEKDINKIVKFVKNNKIDITIVGPEDPLAFGIVDIFQRNGLKIFGPIKKAAMLEASKSFAKKLMNKQNVPTGKFIAFKDLEKAINYVKGSNFPLVIKADGLAKGKGVFIVNSFAQAKNIINEIMKKKIFGKAGEKILIEEFLEGDELTVLAFTDGNTIEVMPPARDYKRLMDNNRGPNTGGMGAFAPVKISKGELKDIKERILVPIIKGLREEGIKYKGVLYAGLIKTKEGYKVLEFNCRFGDPETQVILPLLATDFIDVVEAIIEERLDKVKIKWHNKSAITVVLASYGYPGKYEKLLRISGLRNIKEKRVMIFHAGTIIQNNICRTNGGRVLNVTAIAGSIKKARKIAYNTIKVIHFKKMIYRKDIAIVN